MQPQLNRRRFLLAAGANVFCGRAPITGSANNAQRWIVAIGGCGGNLLDALYARGLQRFATFPQVRSMRIDYSTSDSEFRSRTADIHVRLHERYCGSGGDPEQSAADFATQSCGISRHLNDAAGVLILAGIGGGTGYAATLALTRQLSARATPRMVIAVTPFEFEQASQQTVMRLINLRSFASVAPIPLSSLISNDDEPIEWVFQRSEQAVATACLTWISRQFCGT